MPLPPILKNLLRLPIRPTFSERDSWKKALRAQRRHRRPRIKSGDGHDAEKAFSDRSRSPSFGIMHRALFG
jgi:hypothetical protein